MIGYLMGEILENGDGKLLVAVGDRNQAGLVGYSVSVPQSSFYDKMNQGQRIELFVYTHVREEAFDLYGFQTQMEKALFLTLLSVNGIGPKSALGILSAVKSDELIKAIMQGDQAFLTQIPGIGKKTAERVVVELRDQVKKKVEQGIFSTQKNLLVNEIAISLGTEQSIPFFNESELIKDAKAALIGLGYKEQVVQQLISRALKNQDFHPKGPEDLIRTALRQLA